MTKLTTITFVEGQLSAGHYGSASEVVQAGLHLLEAQEAKLAQQLRAALVEGEESVVVEAFDAEDLLARLHAEHASGLLPPGAILGDTAQEWRARKRGRR